MHMSVKLDVDGDGAWPDFDAANAKRGELIAVSALPGGTTSGRPSVGMRIRLDDGTEVFAETSMRLFQMAAAAFHARYGIVE